LVEARANARWSLDFVHDQFASGQRFRVLNVIDDVTRECLATIPATSISGRRVARELTALIEHRGKRGMIVSDNVTELTSNAILRRCSENRIEWHCIAPAARQRFACKPREGASRCRMGLSKALTAGCGTNRSTRLYCTTKLMLASSSRLGPPARTPSAGIRL
jgi:transposase InsO family protein